MGTLGLDFKYLTTGIKYIHYKSCGVLNVAICMKIIFIIHWFRIYYQTLKLWMKEALTEECKQ